MPHLKGRTLLSTLAPFQGALKSLKSLNVLIMLYNEFKAPSMLIFIREDLNHIQYLFLLKDISPSSLKISNHARYTTL